MAGVPLPTVRHGFVLSRITLADEVSSFVGLLPDQSRTRGRHGGDVQEIALADGPGPVGVPAPNHRVSCANASPIRCASDDVFACAMFDVTATTMPPSRAVVSDITMPPASMPSTAPG